MDDKTTSHSKRGLQPTPICDRWREWEWTRRYFRGERADRVTDEEREQWAKEEAKAKAEREGI